MRLPILTSVARPTQMCATHESNKKNNRWSIFKYKKHM